MRYVFVIVCLFFTACQSPQSKDKEYYMAAHLNQSIADEYANVQQLAKGTAYNIDSLHRVVFDSTKEDIAKLGIIMMAQDSIRLRFGR